VRRWTWPPDKWERLTTVADLAGECPSVLDVGGRGSEMRQLRPAGTSCVSANLEAPCDVVIPADRLPFADDSFAAITSCDVLEHVPPAQRAGHLAELVRVAAERVVICFPAWSPQKEAAEVRLHARLAELGARFDFLDEHLEHGLPRVADVVAAVSAAAPTARVRVRYQQESDDAGSRLLVDAVTAWKRHQLRSAVRFLRGWVRRPATRFSDVADAESSRAYVVIDLVA
jgi:hypothetical protein